MGRSSLIKVIGNVEFLGKYKYQAVVTVKRKTNGDYFVKFEFENLSTDNFKQLSMLSSIRQAIKVNCDIFDQEEYQIPQLVIIRRKSYLTETMEWDCHCYHSSLAAV